jgi:beta-lactamase regulating signal transducer with metallopeptidase domain
MSSGSEIAWLLGQHLIITTGLAAIVFLICRAIRLSPVPRHVLWLLVLCRLLVPPIATWPWSISIAANDLQAMADVDASWTDNDSAVIESGRTSSSTDISMLDTVPAVEAAIDGSGRDVIDSHSVTSGDLDIAKVVAANAVEQNDAVSGMPIAWSIAGLWGIGSMTVFVVLVFRVRRVNRMLKNKASSNTWLRGDVAEFCQRLAVRPPDCVVTDAIRSPFLWCLGRVRLVWPLSVSGSEQREQVRPVLVHELAHLKRHDHWTAWVEILALVVWWWNPLFWFVRRQLRASAEMACDAWVVELLPDQRRAYAELLVEFSRRGRTSQLAFGAVGADTGSRRMFRKRLEMIMKENFATRLPKWTASFAVLLGLFSLPTFALEPIAQPKDAIAEASASDAKSLAELVVMFNELMNERRFAEAEIVAGKAAELAPETPIAVAMVAKSRTAGRQE